MNHKVYEETFSGHRLRYAFQNTNTFKYMLPYVDEVNSRNFDILASNEYIEKYREYNKENSDLAYIEYKSLINLTSLQLLQYHTCIIHAVAFEWKGYCWLMSGPSGVGKTTQYKNWKISFKDAVQMISGDMPVLKLEANQTVTVHPSPWNGKERIKGSVSAQLGGIIILEQSNIDEIAPMKPSNSAIPLFLQFAVRPETEQHVMELSLLENTILTKYHVWKMKNRGDLNSVYLAAEVFEQCIREAQTQ